MDILILSRKRSFYSTRRLLDAARAAGHRVRMVNPLKCNVTVGTRRPGVYVHQKRLTNADIVVARIGQMMHTYGLAVAAHLEAAGTRVINRAEAIRRAQGKMSSLQLLTAAGIAIPPTVLTRNPRGLTKAIAMVGGAPVVLKLLYGTQGLGVILAESAAGAASTIDTLWGLEQNLLIQQYVATSHGRDVRALVVGDRVVASMRRVAARNEFRSNIHRGGRGEPVTLDPAVQALAVRATRVHGLEIAGVDLLDTGDGPLVLEVNPSPGFEGLERVCGRHIAEILLEYMTHGTPPQDAPGGAGV